MNTLMYHCLHCVWRLICYPCCEMVYDFMIENSVKIVQTQKKKKTINSYLCTTIGIELFGTLNNLAASPCVISLAS